MPRNGTDKPFLLPRYGLSACIFSSFIVILLIAASHARNVLWDNEIALWNNAVVKSPGKARVHFLLGHAFRHIDQNKALEQFLIATALDPTDSDAYNNLGAIFNEKDQPDMAIKYFMIALRLKPDNLNTRYNLATAFMKKGSLHEAREELEFILRADPGDVEARKDLDSLSGL